MEVEGSIVDDGEEKLLRGSATSSEIKYASLNGSIKMVVEPAFIRRAKKFLDHRITL